MGEQLAKNVFYKCIQKSMLNLYLKANKCPHKNSLDIDWCFCTLKNSSLKLLENISLDSFIIFLFMKNLLPTKNKLILLI